MQILFLTPAYPPFRGGGERYAYELAQCLQQRGWGVTVFTTTVLNETEFWQPHSPSETVVEAIEDGIRVVRCGVQKMPGGRAGLIAWRKAMVLCSLLPGDQSKLLMRMAGRVPNIPRLESALGKLSDDFDLVHGFNISWEFPLVAAWRLSRGIAKPLIVTPFAHLGTTGKDRVARNSTMDHQRRIMTDADAVLALTSAEKDGLARLGVPREQLDTVGSGVGAVPQIPDPTGVLQRYSLQTPFILFVGRASYEKGAIHATQAVLSLRRKGTHVDLALIGQVAPEFERFYRRLTAEEQRCIRPLGSIGDTEKHALLRASSMLTLPSRTDSFGIVLLEAWIHGKPVIGARAGGIPDVIDDGQNGILVEFGDVSALARAMQRLLDDGALNISMGRYGWEKVTSVYSWERVSRRVMANYREVLAHYKALPSP